MVAKSEKIQLKLRVLPKKPGVYKFLDKGGRMLYVGKAKDLKSRVSSYFGKNPASGKTRVLVKQIEDIEYIVVATEFDALLLENSLIKQWQPKYNIQLKDDKTYPWICIKKEPFPRVFTTRRMIKDGSKYFGPYPSVRMVNTLLSLIRDLYPLRTCALDLSPKKIAEAKHKVCLEYHIGNCKGGCVGLESEETYDQYIRHVEHIIKGNLKQVIRSLKTIMHENAAALKFEEAQLIKSKIETIERYKAKSTVVSPSIHKVDVITVRQDQKSAFINYLVICNGAIIHGYTVEVQKKLDENEQDIIAYVLPELRVRFKSDSELVLLEKNMEVKLSGIRFFVPRRGDKKALIDLSVRNTKFYRLEKMKQDKITRTQIPSKRILEQMKLDFRLEQSPVHIECFDNSNLQGSNAVAACVVFKNAKPSKKDYRHFTIKTVQGSDDFASMAEVVKRRYKRLLDEKEPLPQLVVVDGGKGQLSAAVGALEELNLVGTIAIVGIAKRLEEIFFPDDPVPLYLDKRSESLRLIQRLRNEAHRFGVEHHRNKRSRASLSSELTKIKGIGPKTQQQLMHEFKSISKIRNASLEELRRVVGGAKAKTIEGYFS